MSSTRIVAAMVIVIAALGFFAWNEKPKAYPFTILHAGILAGCMVFGQSLQARQGSLQSGINQPGTAEGAPRRGDAE